MEDNSILSNPRLSCTEDCRATQGGGTHAKEAGDELPSF